MRNRHPLEHADHLLYRRVAKATATREGSCRKLVTQALEVGHTVTAFARDPTKLEIKHSGLEMIEGDVMDPALVDGAVTGHQEAHVIRSGLDWTIVRPAAYTAGERTGNYRHGFPATAKGLRLKISRADVADFLLNQLADNRYVHRTPGVSY